MYANRCSASDLDWGLSGWLFTRYEPGVMTTIILVISGILLAAAAALMVVWYGGDAFEGGSAKARAAAAISEVQQVSFALQIRRASETPDLTARTYQTNQRTLESEGWLERTPHEVVTVDADGYGFGAIDHVYLVLGPDTDAEARKACVIIEATAGRQGVVERIGSPPEWKAAAARRGRFGCFQYHTGLYVVVDHV